jgi:alpha-N-arabinofuranosidase
MKAEPVLAVYAGYSLGGTHVNPGPDLEPFIKEALEEIEYVTGDAKATAWGARRAKDGHPAPYQLQYVEIGNEDWFDKSDSYDARFVQFNKAIKAKYPDLKLIATISKNDQPTNVGVHSMIPDMTDEHYYLPTQEFLTKSPTYADNYSRKSPEIFVGEWAAYENPSPKPWEAGSKSLPPTPAMKTAVGDAAFLTAIERNADIIKMECYAPMFVNVNPGARQWRPNLIGYDAISVYGSPSYYVLRMFGSNLGDQMLSATVFETSVQGCATRNSKTGEIFVKLVNPDLTDAPVAISLKGVSSVSSKATAITLSGKPEESNSIDEPGKILPQTTTVTGVKPDFTYTLPPYSVVVLKLTAKVAK